MREEIEEKINKLIEILDNDNRIIEIDKLKKKITTNKELISKIEKLRTLDKYSSAYQELKKDIFKNNDFVSFKEYENEINYLILEINNHLKTLTNERKCSNESN